MRLPRSTDFTLGGACFLYLEIHMTFNVTIDFKRGASFGPLPVSAASEQQAIEQATREARGFGFDAPVKKAKAVPATQ